LMNMDSYSKPIVYNAQPIVLMGKTIGYIFPHLKVFGSSFLHKALLLLIRLKCIIESLLKKSELLSIPTKED